MSKSTRGKIVTGGDGGAATESRHGGPGRALEGTDGPRLSRGMDDQGGHWMDWTDWTDWMG